MALTACIFGHSLRVEIVVIYSCKFFCLTQLNIFSPHCRDVSAAMKECVINWLFLECLELP